MTSLYVAWQDPDSRTWTPVAKLSKTEMGYQLNYTQGARKLQNFSGLGRMVELDKTYYSSELFSFFANRIINKSRPEFKNYQRWLGLAASPNDDPMSILAITGGLRATDSIDLIAEPIFSGKNLSFDFFLRGLRHLALPHDFLKNLQEKTQIYLAPDVQNKFDETAILLRSENPSTLLGYLPRYFSKFIGKELSKNQNNVRAELRKNNHDAPLDMRLLCRLVVSNTSDSNIFEDEPDFKPLEKNSTISLNA